MKAMLITIDEYGQYIDAIDSAITNIRLKIKENWENTKGTLALRMFKCHWWGHFLNKCNQRLQQKQQFLCVRKR